MTTPRRCHPNPTMYTVLRDALRRHGGPLPSELLDEGSVAWLRENGHPVPELPPPDPRTAAATSRRLGRLP